MNPKMEAMKMSENDLKIKSWFLAFAKDPLQLHNSNNSVLET